MTVKEVIGNVPDFEDILETVESVLTQLLGWSVENKRVSIFFLPNSQMPRATWSVYNLY